MKNLARLILVTTILLSLFVSAANASTYYATGDGVRIRSEPKNANNIIGKLKYGDKVNVLESKGGWSQIEFGNGIGYVTNTFLVENLEEKYAAFINLGLTKKEIALKKSYSTTSKTICTIPINSVIVVVKSKSGWSAVQYNGKEGYVKTKDLIIKNTGKKVCLGSYTITFHQNDSTRTDNIQKAIKKLNGYTVKAGEKFSFFNVVGTNYIEATEFYEDDVMYGGGLSHIASTLNKAINNAQHNGSNIAVKEKHRFSKKTPYAKKGEESIVSIEKKLNFTFKNNNKYALKIYVLSRGDSIIVMLFR